MNAITDLKQIDTSKIEGKLLMAALAKITTESQTDKTPYEVLKQLNDLSEFMFGECKDNCDGNCSCKN